MPINPALLIAAPMLQDSFVDKNGTLMANGTVTCYHDDSRTTLKNWYYQTGTPGNYTFLALPNPLTLSAAGTICDINGVDTIPFFYPYLETDEAVIDKYYITIVNQFDTNQITRANFPYNIEESGGLTTVTSFNNLIVNNGFWRNIAPNIVNTPLVSVALSTPFLSAMPVTIGAVTTLYAGIVAPSQHDGFSMPDIQFLKDNLSATETVTFVPFPLTNTQPISNNIVSEYYLSHNTTSAGISETVKCYQFPISLHINTLPSVNYTVTIQAQNAGSSGVITLNILQFTGTGTSSPIPTVIASTPITLSNVWNEYSLTDVFPPSAGLTLGFGADDAFYLQVQMPLNTPCTINFTKPSIYLTTNVVPEVDFTTYDQVGAIIDSPRTGDIRISLNEFYPYGWVPMNDNFIGLFANGLPSGPTGFYAAVGPFTWQLFNLIWELAKPYDSGSSSNPIALMAINNGATFVATNYGASAYADFSSVGPVKALQLTRLMGKVLMGAVPLSAIQTGTYTQTASASNSGGKLLITVSNSDFFFIGQPITFTSSATLPAPLVANAVYFVSTLNVTVANTFFVATSFANALAGTVIAFGSAGSGTQTIMGIYAGTQTGEYSHAQLLSEMVNHTHNPLAPAVNFLGGLSAGGSATVPAGTLVIAEPTTGLITGYPAAQSRFNVTQPGTFYNMYMKL